MCEVNVPGDMQDQIIKEVEQENIPPTVFDAALQEVLDMIYTNSLHRFKRHQLYNNIV